MKAVYDLIKKIRTEKGLSQDFIANQLGLSQNSYGRTERGETELTIERLSQIADILGMNVTDLVAMAEGRTQAEQDNAKDEEIRQLKRQIAELEAEFEEPDPEEEKAQLVHNALTATLILPLITTLQEAEVELKKHGFDVQEKVKERIKTVAMFLPPNAKLTEILESEDGLKIFLLSLLKVDSSQFNKRI